MASALEHVRVLDLSIARAGPACVRQLADWGADVVRIESPEPHPSVLGTGRDGSDFQNLHRNKRSCTLNLKSRVGLSVFYRLVEGCDVVVENMRPEVKHRLGIDYATLAEHNPCLVYGSVSGFGQDGPYAERGGVDQVAQGMSGLMSITGLPGQGPVRSGAALTDLVAGISLAAGILAALLERERSGRGQWVTTSLLEAGIGLLDFQATRWTIDGEVPGQAGNHHPTAIPMGCFPTADGFVNICGSSGRVQERFFAVIGAPELVHDERFDSSEKRSARRDELNAIIAERLAGRSTTAWVDALTAAGVPAGPVNAVDEVFADEQVRHLAMTETVEHARLGPLDLVRNPVSFRRTPAMLRRPTPELGEHTDEVLGELGLTPSEIGELRSQGVV